MKSSTPVHGTHVWVRIDLVEAVLENDGRVPKGWKPRKRTRVSPAATAAGLGNDEYAWGWCRALVHTATTTTTTPVTGMAPTKSNSNGTVMKTPERKTPMQPNLGNNNNPYGEVKLRKTGNTPPPPPNTAGAPSPWRMKSPDRPASQTGHMVSVSLTVDDVDLAPPHLQNVTVDNLMYNTSDVSKVCAANIWWAANDDPPADLTMLEQLHEPAVVFCLQRRYELDHIYTYTGKILLALNPFRVLDNVYGEEVMQRYWNRDYEDERPAPHIYATAEDSYQSMMRSFGNSNAHHHHHHSKSKRENQSILVSGESGAGKTVTTKIIMRYLATLSERSEGRRRQSIKNDQDKRSISMETQVLQSNPILESFGNARTIRNDNSSRFGKFIEMQFHANGSLISASMETYLLEKVRLISQTPGERNYHIFYELLAGLPRQDRRALRISHSTAMDFRMTAESGTFDRRDGVSDKETFQELRTALDTVGFSAEEQMDFFKVVCGLLHASNLTFTESGPDASALKKGNPHLRAVVDLLGLEADRLNVALCQVLIEARGERLYKNLSVASAQKAVEALIKATYGALFEYVVRRVNESMAARQQLPDHGGASTASIGVLDIFGFESFETNSFEQLCINYCNEALQQQFNRFVFKLEQQEYQKEGIDWSFISFPDNQDVLDLIDKKHDGILSILDEQCRLSRCTDRSFAMAVYEKCRDHPRLVVSKHQEADLVFSILHYAGLVQYDTENFLEKNKDELPKETTELLKSSTYPFLASLGHLLQESTSTPSARETPNRKQLYRSSSSIMRESVGIQFSSRLRELRTRIEATSPHYVRCLKPNDELIPHNFDALVISDQLRCAGVLEAIRVSRVGFPHRYTLHHFVERYGLLARDSLNRFGRRKTASEACEALVSALVPQLCNLMESTGVGENMIVPSRANPGKITFLGMQMGKSKVFLRLRAFEALEQLRSKKLEKSAIVIQSFARMCSAQTQLSIAIYAATIIQNFVRRVESFRAIQQLRAESSAQTIACAYRCYRARRILFAAYCIACWCQSIFRGSVARQLAAYIFLDRKAFTIQQAWHKHCMTKTFRKIRSAVTTIQNRHRSRVAFRELCSLRQEARTLTTVAAERDKFRDESRRLREELEREKTKPISAEEKAAIRKERAEEVIRLHDEVHRLQLELEKAHRLTSPSKESNGEVERLLEEVARKEEQLGDLRAELETLKSHNDSSFSIKSLTLENVANESHTEMDDSFSGNKRSSPARSDVSLLDSAGENIRGNSMIMSPQDESFAPAVAVNVNDGEALRQLHNAIRQGNVQLFNRILNSAQDACLLMNQGDRYGRTALHLASMLSNVEIATILVQNSAVVNCQDEDGETPLHLAESLELTEVLLRKGKANPNIPNVDGICALHLAVQRRDIDSVRALLRSMANVNNADNIRWFTALHLIALPARNEADGTHDSELRCHIAQMLCGSSEMISPDIDYQDREGNTPLHYAVQLETSDACEMVSIFLERGADPNICNERNQTALHLLCHNTYLRDLGVFHTAIHSMLFHGADPNKQSLTGCTALHLSLYHKDIESAVQLIGKGAELHVPWKKPKKWATFWNDMGAPEVLALDMVVDPNYLHRTLSAITRPQKWAPARSWCMNCQSMLGTFARAMHCKHCARLICGQCASSCLPPHYFPKGFDLQTASWVCGTCEKILVSRKDDMSTGTYPTSSYGEEEEEFPNHLQLEQQPEQHFEC